MFRELLYITTVISTQSVLHASSSFQHALIFSLLYHGKQNPPRLADQCVFIRGLRAKRSLKRSLFFLSKPIWLSQGAAAEPFPDGPDNHKGDGKQVPQAPGIPKAGKNHNDLPVVLSPPAVLHTACRGFGLHCGFGLYCGGSGGLSALDMTVAFNILSASPQ